MTSSLTRRGLVAVAPAAVVAAALASTVIANELDADLLALRPIWIAKRAEFEAALNALTAAERRCAKRQPTFPDYMSFKGTFEEYRIECERIREITVALEIETGVAAAHEAEHLTSAADMAMVEEIFAIPARTMEGIRFKREVFHDWKDCLREDMQQSILNDLLAMGGLDA